MKCYEVEHHGLPYTVQLHPDTAEALGVEPVTDGPKKRKSVSRETRKKNVSRGTSTSAGESVEGAETKE